MPALPNQPPPRLPAPPPLATLFLLDTAYQRPCYCCMRTGPCRHREPLVELAEATQSPAAPGEPLPWDRPSARMRPGRAEAL